MHMGSCSPGCQLPLALLILQLLLHGLHRAEHGVVKIDTQIWRDDQSIGRLCSHAVKIRSSKMDEHSAPLQVLPSP